jgi:carboxylesterase
MSRLNDLLRQEGTVRVLPQTRPIRKDPPLAREAVLLLHGFSGSPAEMLPLAESLADAGYAVRAPRYPGHGSTRDDFMRTDAEDWARRAFDAYLDLRAEYDTVHVAGHSMGGLLATAVASTFGAARLILFAPAFELKRKAILLTPIASPVVKVIPVGRPLPERDRDDPVRSALHADYWADDLVSPSAELARLIRECRPLASRVTARVLVVTGAEDDTVPAEIGDWAKARMRRAASVETHVLEGAGHLLTFDDNRDRTISLVMDWLKR